MAEVLNIGGRRFIEEPVRQREVYIDPAYARGVGGGERLIVQGRRRQGGGGGGGGRRLRKRYNGGAPHQKYDGAAVAAASSMTGLPPGVALAIRENQLIDEPTKVKLAANLQNLRQDFIEKTQDAVRESIIEGGGSSKKGFFSGEKGTRRIVIIAIVLVSILLAGMGLYVAYNIYRNLSRSNDITYKKPTTTTSTTAAAAPTSSTTNRQATLNPDIPPKTDEEIRQQLTGGVTRS